MSKVLIVGGGAAGMFASIFAAKNGNEVHVFEKNEKLGKKLFITGKGRCNITNACDMEGLFDAVRTNATSPMPVTWMNFSRIWYPMRNSCTAVFTDLPTRM